MKTLRLRRFSHPEVLRAMAPSRLHALLEPHRAFLAERGFQLPDLPNAQEINPWQLLQVFLAADTLMPRPLVEAFYFIDQLSSDENMEAIVTAAELRGVRLNVGSDPTPADVVAEAWLRCRDVVERQYGSRFIRRRRKFVYFQSGRRIVPRFEAPSRDRIEALERVLDAWFVEHHRGRGTRILTYQREDGIWFLIRHGEPLKRAETLKEGEADTVYYRPLRYDVVVYIPDIGELRVNSRTEGEKNLYRHEFGHHLFGDYNFFPGDAKYSLEPLREDGPASLSCSDVEGIEWVRLREVQLYCGGNHHRTLVNKAEDVFAALAEDRERLPEAARLQSAVFEVKFADSDSPRSVLIRPCNIAQYSRDADAALIETWLERRGFSEQLYGRLEVPCALLERR